jgi:hypothetical protein
MIRGRFSNEPALFFNLVRRNIVIDNSDELKMDEVSLYWDTKTIGHRLINRSNGEIVGSVWFDNGNYVSVCCGELRHFIDEFSAKKWILSKLADSLTDSVKSHDDVLCSSETGLSIRVVLGDAIIAVLSNCTHIWLNVSARMIVAIVSSSFKPCVYTRVYDARPEVDSVTSSQYCETLFNEFIASGAITLWRDHVIVISYDELPKSKGHDINCLSYRQGADAAALRHLLLSVYESCSAREGFAFVEALKLVCPGDLLIDRYWSLSIEATVRDVATSFKQSKAAK